MVSPELLRRYPFFALLDDDQLQAVAMITQEKKLSKRRPAGQREHRCHLFVLADRRGY